MWYVLSNRYERIETEKKETYICPLHTPPQIGTAGEIKKP
jgi:hypothetical protein